MSERERWRKVRGWPYKVSDRGRVRSLPRVLPNGAEHGGGLLAQAPDGDGYLMVHLRDGQRERRVGVHVLVAQAFPCFDGLEVRHLNGQADNRWTSLRWGTHRENEQDKRKGKNGIRAGAEMDTASRHFPAVTTIAGELR